jgi:hypothetical protein
MYMMYLISIYENGNTIISLPHQRFKVNNTRDILINDETTGMGFYHCVVTWLAGVNKCCITEAQGELNRVVLL